jgi:hypothetical protein
MQGRAPIQECDRSYCEEYSGHSISKTFHCDPPFLVSLVGMMKLFFAAHPRFDSKMLNGPLLGVAGFASFRRRFFQAFVASPPFLAQVSLLF